MRSSNAPVVLLALALAIPYSAPAQNPARIFVYAQRETPAASWLPISCDGAVVAELKQGRLFALNLSPGRHSIGTEKGVPASIDIRPGEDSFVRLDWDLASDRAAIPVLTIVPPDRAAKETMFLSYIKANKALSASVPKSDPRQPARKQFKTR